MAFEQNFTKEWKSKAPEAAAAAADTAKSSACFDCNICLDFAHEPVVTLCGHLYCWPCIYKWFHFQENSLASDDHPQCPVCKATISQTTLVPLYRRDHSPLEPELNINATLRKMAIPPRPSACGRQQSFTNSSIPGEPLLQHNPYQNPQYFPVQYTSYREDLSSPSFNLGSSSSPRLRRQEMQAEKYLNRISIFLFCCFHLCLLLF